MKKDIEKIVQEHTIGRERIDIVDWDELYQAISDYIEKNYVEKGDSGQIKIRLQGWKNGIKWHKKQYNCSCEEDYLTSGGSRDKSKKIEKLDVKTTSILRYDRVIWDKINELIEAVNRK